MFQSHIAACCNTDRIPSQWKDSKIIRKERSTTDMTFVLRLLQEKCREQHRDLLAVFVDLSKAFDTVDRELLWKILGKFGCPAKFVGVKSLCMIE